MFETHHANSDWADVTLLAPSFSHSYRARVIPSSKNCCKGEMNVKMVTDACIKLEPFLERQGLQSGDELHS